MDPDPTGAVDTLTLRFVGHREDGSPIHELRAAHVAEVLQGVVGLAGDMAQAGAFDAEGPIASEVLVRPAEEGSFIIEVVRFAAEHPDVVGVALGGTPSLAGIIWWATKSVRADVKDFDYLDDDTVKVVWQDDTADEIPRRVWDELKKRKRRRKKHLQQIMAPLGDPLVSAVEVQSPAALPNTPDESPTSEDFTLTRPDYQAVLPSDEITETQDIFEVEAQMSAIDFDDPTKWRVKTTSVTRGVIVEDEGFLTRVRDGLALRASDIFRLTVRQDTVEKNGQTRSKWTVLKVESYRRAAHDDDD